MGVHRHIPGEVVQQLRLQPLLAADEQIQPVFAVGLRADLIDRFESAAERLRRFEAIREGDIEDAPVGVEQLLGRVGQAALLDIAADALAQQVGELPRQVVVGVARGARM